MGYSIAYAYAYAYLPVPEVAVGAEVFVEIFGRQVPGVVAADPLFDPKGARVRADAG